MEETNKYRLVGAGVMLFFTLVLIPLIFHRAPTAPTQAPDAHFLPPVAALKSPPQPTKVSEAAHYAPAPVAEIDLDEIPPEEQVEKISAMPAEHEEIKEHKLEPVKVTHHEEVKESKEKALDIDPLTQVKATPKKSDKPDVVAASKPVVKKVEAKPVVAKAKPIAPVAKQPALKAGWVIQVASLSDDAHANRLVAELKAKGFPAFSQTTKTPKGLPLTRVLIGPDQFRSKADARLRLVSEKAKVRAIVVAYPIGRRG